MRFHHRPTPEGVGWIYLSAFTDGMILSYLLGFAQLVNVTVARVVSTT